MNIKQSTGHGGLHSRGQQSSRCHVGGVCREPNARARRRPAAETRLQVRAGAAMRLLAVIPILGSPLTLEGLKIQ